MAQDLIDKRRNIATNTVIHATRLVDALRALDALQEEVAQVTFVQSDFDGTSLKHLSPALMAAIYGGGGAVDDLMTQLGANGNLLEVRQ